jgi:predicted RNase H-like HicB family nuclease
MGHPIEADRDQDGQWAAKIARIPGLVVYGYSREEALASVRILSAILRDDDVQQGRRILAFYPGKLPDYFQPGHSI